MSLSTDHCIEVQPTWYETYLFLYIYTTYFLISNFIALNRMQMDATLVHIKYTKRIPNRKQEKNINLKKLQK
jgi:hypothetical protein